MDDRGYILETCKGHPKARIGRSDYVYQHVLIAERVLGRYLPDGAEVHHVDEDKTNNINHNLVICENHAYHMALHARTRIVKAGGIPDIHKVCGSCDLLLLRELFYRKKTETDGLYYFCKECTKFQHKQSYLRNKVRRSVR